MTNSSPAERIRKNATGIASTLVTGVWLSLLLIGHSWWIGALLFGYIVFIPVVSMIFDEEYDDEEYDDWQQSGSWRSKTNTSSTPDTESQTPTKAATPAETPLETIRRRYAEGELTEAQFERKVEQLLETETLEDIEDARRDRLIESN
ncbi:hypothetical protein AUR64_14475 [Haloprofundus marisrubri]|uniref:SHOCT domain-containing protein n=1 Tax=Haloprofundus marisrubri TaxID=1514971 RepID=A0A0W1R6J3_9EURY|nr:SHOCT domain-containing protein [Haloprofundus marisrubri]KTG09006.1 hypothetical protein AUR64_14475 [Haloprofundus marisrubri]